MKCPVKIAVGYVSPRLVPSLFMWVLASASAVAQVSQEGVAAVRNGPDVKFDLREMWLELEDFQDQLASNGQPAETAQKSEIGRSVDAATRMWWLGFQNPDLEKLAGATRKLRKVPEPEAEAVARSLEVRPEPFTLIQGGAPVELSIDSQYPATWTGPQSLELVLRATGPGGKTLESAAFRIDPKAKLDVHTKVTFPAAPKDGTAPAGAWRLELVAQSAKCEPVHVGAAWVVPQSLDAVRVANESKLSLLLPKLAERKNASLTDAAKTFGARNALLRDVPDRNASAQFLLDPVQHVASLERELAELERFTDPYRLLPGDLWRILPVEIDGKPAAVHVYAPAAVEAQKPLPLVIVLGSMHMDENVLLDLTLPRLRQLAEARGFLVAALRTNPQAFKAARFDALMSALEDDFLIDQKQVYLFGHASGAGQLGVLLHERGDRVAACVSLGAADVKFGERHVPTVIVAGSADEFDAPGKLDRQASKYRNATSAVTFRTIEGASWYTLPDAALEFGIGWLFERKLE